MASNTSGITVSGVVDEPVVVDVHESRAPRRLLRDVERHEPVDVLADELEHVATDLVGVGVR